MEKEVLDVVLKKVARESEIAHVLEAEFISALPKGENYSSTIYRVKLKVVLGNGRVAKTSLILKQVITKEKTGKWMKELNIAKVEAKVYSVILAEMGYLMEEFQDTDTPLWCKFINYDPASSSLLLEDLKRTGYRLVPRQKGLDLDHGILVMRSLGRYHGMVKVLEERGIVSKDEYRQYALLTDKTLIKSVFYPGLKNTRKVMLEHWGQEWKALAQKMNLPTFEEFVERLKKLCEFNESEFTVLNHGDCWSNNMMFKYDWQDQPISVKFLDFQLPHYNTPCTDLTIFMYFGIQPHVRRENFNLFLENYHDSLIKTLDKFGFSGSRPSLTQITEAMDRLSYFGLTFFISNYAFVVSKSTDGFDVEKTLQTEGELGMNIEVLLEEGLKERMGPDIIDYVQKFYPS